MAEIDSLEIKIEGSVKKANDAIDSLVKNLDRLTNSLKIDTSGLEKIGKLMNLSGIGKSANNIKSQMNDISKSFGKTQADINQMVKEISRKSVFLMPEINTSNIQGEIKKYENQLRNSQNALNRLVVMPDAEKQIGKIATLTAKINEAENALGRIAEINGKYQEMLTEMNTQGFENVRVEMEQVEETARQMGEQIKESTSRIGFKSYNSGEIQKFIDDHVLASEKVDNLSSKSNMLKNEINEVNKAAKNTAGLKNVGNNAEKASKSFSSLSKSSLKASNSLKKVQSSLKGVLRALLPILGIRELVRFGKESIKNSMDYIEVLNYFDAAFGQVAQNADLSAFEEMGYDSADAYYNSFAQRAEELTAKMSGFTVGEGGLLESTGAVSLGLDPSQLMNYQAMFAQMASSMGATSETSLKLSQALTEIGADLASVKNMEFEDVWNDMASGLAGMSRTLDKYGVNIRNVNLQQKLTELGINANIAALNQNDKALLRTIILLDSTRYAWGDLADTINQPANQLRLIQANFQNLARTIGNLFLPIVKTVLPYINALVIAVQRLFAWLGNLIGIDISGISTSMGKTDISGFLDQTDDLSNSLGGVAENAKKAKAGLRAFDELNVINAPETDTGAGNLGGIGGAGLLDEAFNKSFEEYQKVWDEAFGKLENRAQELADKIVRAFEPVKRIIQDFAVGDFFQAGKDTSALVAGIFNFFADAIDKVDWYEIGKEIGDFFAGINWASIFKSVFKLIGEAFKAAFEAWLGLIGSAPIEGAIITFFAVDKIAKVVGGIGDAFGAFFGNIAAHPYVAIAGALATVAGVLISLSQMSSDPFRNVSEKAKEMVEELSVALSNMENIKNTYEDIIKNTDAEYETISTLSKKYFELSKKENLSQSDEVLLGKYKSELESYVGDITGYVDEITGAWTGTREEMEELIKKSYEYYKQQAYADYLVEAYKAQANVEIEIEKISLEKENTQKQIDDFYKEVEMIVGRKISRDNLVFDIENLIMSGKLDKNFLKQAQNVEKLIDDLGIYETSLRNATNQLNVHKNEVEILEQVYDDSSVSTEKGSTSIDRNTKSIQENTGKIRENINEVILNEKTAINSNEQVRKSYKQMSSETKGEINSTTERLRIWSKDNETLGSNAGNNLSKKYTENIKNILPNSENILYNLSSTFTQTGTIIGSQTGKNISDSMAQSIEERRIELKNKLSSIFNGITAAINLTGNQIRISTPAYAMGGFPEDGWFRASKGEYFGQFDDGTSYIANNNQIESGIASGVEQAAYQGMMRAMKDMGGFGANVKVTLDPKSESMFKIIKSESDSYINRTRRNPWTGERL